MVRKLGFLQRLVSADGGTLGAEILRSMSDDIESLCLVRECRETFGTHYTNEILGDRDAVSLQDINYKREVHKRDKEMVLEKCATSDRSLAAMKIEERIGWESLWENALVCGESCMGKIRWLVKAFASLM